MDFYRRIDLSRPGFKAALFASGLSIGAAAVNFLEGDGFTTYLVLGVCMAVVAYAQKS